MYLCGMRYRVIGRLGEGGFGSVYLAEDTLLGNTWAIKEAGSSDEVSFSAIRAEISVLSRSSHPGIARITDVFSSNGRIYIVMDHIKGMNLREIMRSKNRIPEKMLFRWCLELCDAVAYLHHMEPPVILRDLKPSNIMVRPDGHIVLIDFGAAVPEKAGSKASFATRKYAAPEQLEGKAADVRSDIYALGRVIDTITGRNKPFGTAAVIKRCTLSDPAHRYRSVNAVKRDLRLCTCLGKLLLFAAAAVITGILLTAGARRSTERVNEAASEKQMEKQAYEQGLLCFYELGDYTAAEKYLEKLPEDEYPEKEYYTELSRLLSGEEPDVSGINEVLKSFEEYNEAVIKAEDPDRYAKNCFCMAKAYLASGRDDGRYDRARALIDGILMQSRDETSQLKDYEADALKLMINILILEGRSGDEAAAVKYHEAIGLIEELIRLPGIRTDKDTVIAKRMDEASLYSELGEYDDAIRLYEETEKDYPYDPAVNYFAHLSLLMQAGADSLKIRTLWNEMGQVEGIREDERYRVMEERVQAVI